MTGSERPALARVIGVRALTLSVVNVVIGSAIFVVPAGVALEMGSTAVVAYLVAAALVLLVALCFAEAASRVTATGGAYAYVERAFGPGPGFVVAWLQWLANGAVSSATVANALVGTLSVLAPVLGSGVPRLAVMAVVFGGLAWINVRGTREGVRAVVVLTVLKLVPILLLLAWGAHLIQPAQLAWTDPIRMGGFGRALLLLVFGLTGMEIALTPTGEVTNPSRTVPIAAVTGVGIGAGLYVAMHLLAQGVLGPELARFQEAPLAEVAARVFGSGGRFLMLAAALVSTLGFLSGDMLATPRSIHALAEDGLMPAWLGRIHPRFRTPHLAVIAYVALTAVIAAAGSFAQLAMLNAIGVLVIYLGVVLSLFKLRRERVTADREPILMPGGPVIPVVALLLVIGLLWVAPIEQQLAGLGFVVLCAIIYRLRRWASGGTRSR